MESWSIELEKEYFKFSAAHFLIFPDGSAERLHGHNYRVFIEIDATLSEHGLVIDFIEAKPVVRELCDELDEHWIIPADHPELKVERRDDGHTEVVYREARYLAPSDEVLVLPINNSSPSLRWPANPQRNVFPRAANWLTPPACPTARWCHPHRAPGTTASSHPVRSPRSGGPRPSSSVWPATSTTG